MSDLFTEVSQEQLEALNELPELTATFGSGWVDVVGVEQLPAAAQRSIAADNARARRQAESDAVSAENDAENQLLKARLAGVEIPDLSTVLARASAVSDSQARAAARQASRAGVPVGPGTELEFIDDARHARQLAINAAKVAGAGVVERAKSRSRMYPHVNPDAGYRNTASTVSQSWHRAFNRRGR